MSVPVQFSPRHAFNPLKRASTGVFSIDDKAEGEHTEKSPPVPPLHPPFKRPKSMPITLSTLISSKISLENVKRKEVSNNVKRFTAKSPPTFNNNRKRTAESAQLKPHSNNTNKKKDWEIRLQEVEGVEDNDDDIKSKLLRQEKNGWENEKDGEKMETDDEEDDEDTDDIDPETGKRLGNKFRFDQFEFDDYEDKEEDMVVSGQSRFDARSTSLHSNGKYRAQFLQELKRQTYHLTTERLAKCSVQDLEFRMIDLTYSVSQDPSIGPIIHMYGYTRGCDTATVRLDVHGFKPYFFVRKPEAWGKKEVNEFCDWLKSTVQAEHKNTRNTGSGNSNNDLYSKYGNLILEQKVGHYRNIEGFDFGKGMDAIKITVAFPSLVSEMRKLIENCTKTSSKNNPRMLPEHLRQNDLLNYVFEADLPFVNRFMCDNGITGEDWIKVKAGAYGYQNGSQRLPEDLPTPDVDIKLRAVYSNVKPLTEKELAVEPEKIPYPAYDDDPTIDRSSTGKVQLSFDFEVLCEKKVVPKDGKRPIIDIGVTVKSLARPNDRKFYCFVLGSCPPTLTHKGRNITVFSFDDEREMLKAYREFYLMINPDVDTGFNTDNYDWPYLKARTEELGLTNYMYMSRDPTRQTTIKKANSSTRGAGTIERQDVTSIGRTMFDAHGFIRKMHVLRSYALGDVGMHFLKVPKEEMDYEKIPYHFKTEKGRIKLAIYCVHDAFMADALLDHLVALVDAEETARDNHMTIDGILKRGQTARCKCNVYDYGFNHVDVKTGKPLRILVPTRNEEARKHARQLKYAGAHVEEARRGLYICPVSTLDFAGLYPSIMMANNMCPSAKKREEDLIAAGFVEGKDYKKIEGTGVCFVLPHVWQGVFPCILKKKTTERGIAKGEMGKHARALESIKKEVEVIEAEFKAPFKQMYPNSDMGGEDWNTFVEKTEVPKEKLMSTALPGQMIYSTVWFTFCYDSKRLHSRYNCRQNATKMTANAMYGALGAAVSFLYDKEVAESVTLEGQRMILAVKRIITRRFRKVNGFPCDCVPIYGDTDSLFFSQFGLTMEEAMEMANQMSKYITLELFGVPEFQADGVTPVMEEVEIEEEDEDGTFLRNADGSIKKKRIVRQKRKVGIIKLEYEKTWRILIMYMKKKYCGEMWLYSVTGKVEKKEKYSGIEVARRDNCIFVPNTMKMCYKLIFEKGEEGVKEAIEYVKKRIYDLRKGRISWHELIISGTLKQDISKYKTETCFTALTKKLNKRANPKNIPGMDAITPGTRMKAVILKGDSKRKSDRVEDPLYAWHNNLELDTDYYLYEALARPIIRLFEPILYKNIDPTEPDNKRRLISMIGSLIFEGEHMRHLKVNNSSKKSNFMKNKFLKRVNLCMGCNNPMPDFSTVVMCDECRLTRHNPMLKKTIDALKENMRKLSVMNEKCQSCVSNDDYQHVDCTSDGCSNLWETMDCERDISNLNEKLDKLSKCAPKGHGDVSRLTRRELVW